MMKESERLKNRMIELRGTIIQETIRVEATIDSILISHYSQAGSIKKKEFHEDILSPMRFEQKKGLIIKLYKYLKYDRSKIQELSKSLTSMQNLRNKVAHWNWVSITDESVLLGKTDYIQFHIDNKAIDEFEKSKKMATFHLIKIWSIHYNSFKDFN